jgi:SAM-dependent methyltransferase
MHTVTDAWFKRVYSDPLYLSLYENDDTALAESEVRAACKLVEPQAGGRWLDVCCGFGRHVEALADTGFQAVGLDASPLMIRRAFERSGGKTRYVQGELESLPFTSTFDVVSCFFDSFGYLPREADHVDGLLSMAGVLGPGGHLLIQLTNREHLIGTWPPPAEETRKGLAIHREWWLDLAKGRYGWRQTIIQDGATTQWEFDLALFSARELSNLLHKAGFSEPRLYGNLAGDPYTAESTHLVLVARKCALGDLISLSH